MTMRIEGFEHLHLHSDFSLLDGYGTVEEYAKRCTEINQRFLTISDHGMMGAVPRQIRACEDNGINPIFASELYVNPMQPEINEGSSADFAKQLSDEDKAFFRRSFHLLAIAYNEVGYSNLVKLTSWAWTKGFYYKPRVNHEQLMKYKEGIIFTSCCYMGEIGQAFDRGGADEAYHMIEKYKNMFGDKFYLEFMLLDFNKQKPYDKFIIQAHEKYHIPLVVTNDVHYCLKEDSQMQRKMLMIQTGRTVQQIQEALARNEVGDFFELQDQNLWLKSEEEINKKWLVDYSDIIEYDVLAEAKRNTVRICEMAKGVELDRSIKLPIIPDADEAFKMAIMRGALGRGIPKTKEYINRIMEEYTLICQKGFSSYFLITKMMTDEARRVCVDLLGYGDGHEAVGPGRGCLSPYVEVVLKHGDTKPISKCLAGDKVLTRNGGLGTIAKVFEYETDEPLYKIKTYYGDSRGISLTGDHLVWAEVSKRPENWLKSSRDTKSWEEPSGELKWVRADDLKVGDWLFIPTPEEKIDIPYNTLMDYIIGKNKKFTTTSLCLANRIRFLLWQFGIPCSLDKSDKKIVLKIPRQEIVFGMEFENSYCKRIKGGIMQRIQSIEEIEGTGKVYDLQVLGAEDNFVTTSGLVHNSAVGALVCYCLGITDVDPLKHDLLFSRFLSPARGGKKYKLSFTNIDPELLDEVA